jgi:hypothetical protein
MFVIEITCVAQIELMMAMGQKGLWPGVRFCDLSRRRSSLVTPSRPVPLRDRGSTVSQKLTNARRDFAV